MINRFVFDRLTSGYPVPLWRGASIEFLVNQEGVLRVSPNSLKRSLNFFSIVTCLFSRVSDFQKSRGKGSRPDRLRSPRSLDATSRLYKRACPSVYRSVGRSVCHASLANWPCFLEVATFFLINTRRKKNHFA